MSVNFYQNNILLLVMIPLVALVPILIAFDKSIPERLLPLALAMIALALLYHTSLISADILGPDIHQEYYFANLVKTNSFWDSTIPNDYNAMLSVVMLAPILSDVTGLSLTFVFKILYPLLFSLVPVVLYEIFKKQTESRTAFLAVFFFMSVFTFFTEMISLARQQIGEIFLVLLILLIINRGVNLRKRWGLLAVFGASLVLAHYALAFIFMCSLISAQLILFLLEKRMRRQSFDTRLNSYITPNRSWKNRAITAVFVVFYCVFLFSWFIYISGSKTFDSIIHVTSLIVKNTFTEFLSPEKAQGLSILLVEPVSIVHQITKMLHILMQLFIVVGLFSLVLRRDKERFNEEYVSLCAVMFVLSLAAIALPYLASSFNTTRLYHVTLIFLALFGVVGAVSVFDLLSRVLSSIVKKRGFVSTQIALKLVSVILGIFLLFNTGFVYEVTRSHPTSISLSQNWIMEYGNANEKLEFYNTYTPTEEVVSAEWLSQHRDDKSIIYSDYRARNNALNAYAMISRSEGLVIYNDTVMVDAKSYVYLRKLNVVDHLMGGSPEVTGSPDLFDAATILSSLSQEANLVYSNGGSEVYYSMYGVKLK
jgi:uncharacterized membrane protein